MYYLVKDGEIKCKSTSRIPARGGVLIEAPLYEYPEYIDGAIVEGSNYKEERRKDYPNIGDQLDVYYKMAKVLTSNGVAIGTDATDLINKIDIVKAAHPKPV